MAAIVTEPFLDGAIAAFDGDRCLDRPARPAMGRSGATTDIDGPPERPRSGDAADPPGPRRDADQRG